jgi:hypothetical protein
MFASRTSPRHCSVQRTCYRTMGGKTDLVNNLQTFFLTGYFSYYHHWRTHRALAMDCPLPRPVQRPEAGLIREVPEVGGLHHHYERRAA